MAREWQAHRRDRLSRHTDPTPMADPDHPEAWRAELLAARDAVAAGATAPSAHRGITAGRHRPGLKDQLAAVGSYIPLAVRAELAPYRYYAHDNMYAAYLTLYVTAYTIGEVLLARGCWRLAQRSKRTSVRVGLRVVALGAIVTFGYSGVRTGNVIAGAFGMSLAGWENFAWTCGDVGAMLTLIGWLVPTITDQAKNVQYRLRQYLSYYRLRRLWLAFYSEAPEIRLPVDQGDPARSRRFRSIGFKLYRRAVEIRDGRFVIRQYLEAGVRESSEAHHRVRGLSGEELNAAVSADQILAGIAARKTGERPHPNRLTDFADTDPETSQPMDDIDALLAVARHLPRQRARTLHPERAFA
ncbi:MAB_1171c family putative transporter [Streptomyces sp. DSM 41640]|uniref:MAB_1171c family putative transporter n=1 Tax=Streptomyces doebereineriae TaxID=3075528 RepID=A0ABU2VS14_9ACTN|nr:MAB_1171c family putative transporter [Streptomyces sp. DSM 41640]MDT0488114.1 MAB_1171c family putative transporter [Streptomyces sp. DSM 41640]